MKISIITPNYNYEQYIGHAIESILSQNYDDYEHIIVDDGSTDRSVRLVEDYVIKNSGKVKLVTQSNKGQVSALNEALTHVTGDIIGWLNSDDYYCSNVFKTVIDYFTKYPDLEALYGNIVIVDKNDHVVMHNKYLKFNYAAGVFNGFGKMLSSNAIFWKSELTAEIGGFNPRYDYAMDAEYWSRLLLNRRIRKVAQYFSCFRWHHEAKTIKSRDENSNDHERAFAEVEEIRRTAYQNLVIAKVLPFKYTKPLYLFYRIMHIVKRALCGHYLNRSTIGLIYQRLKRQQIN